MHTKLYLLASLLISFLSLQLSAQTPEWAVYSSPEKINKVVETSEHLWLASSKGVFQIHKATKETVLFNSQNSNLPSDHIQTIILDENEVPWIGTYDVSLAKWNGSDWDQFDPPQQMLDTTFVTYLYSMLFTDSDGLYIGTNKGIIAFDGNNWEYHNPETSLFLGAIPVWQMTESVHPGKVILGTFAPIEYDGETVTEIDPDMHLISYLGNQCDNFDNTIWYADGLANVGTWDGEQWTLYPVFNDTFWNPIPNGFEVNQIIKDNNGDVWTVFNFGGIYKFGGEYWEKQEDAQIDLTNDAADLIWFDEEGRRWLFLSGYASVLEDGVVTEFQLMEHLIFQNYIFKIAEANQEEMYFLNGGKFSAFSNNSWAFLPFPLENTPGQAYLYDISSTKDDKLLVSHSSGVLQYDGQDWTHWEIGKNGLDLGIIHHVEASPSGKLYATHDKKMAEFDGTTWTVYDQNNSPLTDEGIRFIETSYVDENVWLVDYDWNIIRKNGSNWDAWTVDDYPFPYFYFWSDIAVDYDGNLWVAFFHEGVARFDGSEWELYFEDTPLEGRNVANVHTDENGRIYFGLDNGFAIKDGENWEVINADQSPLEAFATTQLFAQPSSNRLWIGTVANGLIRYEEGVVSSENEPGVAGSISKLEITPNPFTDFIRVDFEEVLEEDLRLSVFDANGRNCYVAAVSKGSASTTIGLGELGLENGTYFLKISYRGKTEVKQLIKIDFIQK